MSHKTSINSYRLHNYSLESVETRSNKNYMKVILIIDTTNNKEMSVGLRIDDKEFIKKQPLDTRKAQVVLPMLEKMLQEQRLNLKDLTAIEVNPGPGSFTGIRVG